MACVIRDRYCSDCPPGSFLRRSHSQVRALLPAGRVMLAVLPFENLTGDPSQDYFSDGMTEELIAELGNLDPQHLGVIARTSVMQYKHNTKPLDQIGRELGIQYTLKGFLSAGFRQAAHHSAAHPTEGPDPPLDPAI